MLQILPKGEKGARASHSGMCHALLKCWPVSSTRMHDSANKSLDHQREVGDFSGNIRPFCSKTSVCATPNSSNSFRRPNAREHHTVACDVASKHVAIVFNKNARFRKRSLDYYGEVVAFCSNIRSSKNIRVRNPKLFRFFPTSV